MLRTCYLANSRPDALMKEQLVEMTGLSSRVIRVWFQNKRCKDKKRSVTLKQMQPEQQDKVRASVWFRSEYNAPFTGRVFRYRLTEKSVVIGVVL
jgi:Homeodomain